jgi:flagellar hook-basal body complex protein FliE
MDGSFLAPSWQSSLTQDQSKNFAAILGQQLENLDQGIVNANALVTRFASGENLAPHQVILALEQSRMSLQMALQVRSRLVEGYQELMRMQL